MNYPEKKKILKLAKFTQKIETEFLKGRKALDLINALQKKEINVVVDIRWWNVYPIYFAPKNIKDLLKAYNIDYIQYHKLGNPSKLRKEACKNFELAKELYLDYIIKDFTARQQFVDLFKKLRLKRNYCLICYCRTLNPLLCHRFWLKEALVNTKRLELGFEGNYEIECYYENPVPEVLK